MLTHQVQVSERGCQRDAGECHRAGRRGDRSTPGERHRPGGRQSFDPTVRHRQEAQPEQRAQRHRRQPRRGEPLVDGLSAGQYGDDRAGQRRTLPGEPSALRLQARIPQPGV